MTRWHRLLLIAALAAAPAALARTAAAPPLSPEEVAAGTDTQGNGDHAGAAVNSKASGDSSSSPSMEAQGSASPLPARGVLLGDALRYPRFGRLTGIFVRTAIDMFAIPANMPTWSREDWLWFGSIGATAVAMSIPLHGRSLDVRVQDRVEATLGGPNHPLFWTPSHDFLIWTGIWGLTSGILVYGLAEDSPQYVETAAMMVEAFLVTQLGQFFIKFATGRQGPKDGQGLGEYGGPKYFFKYFPSGTPSGHVGTMVAMFSALTTYWNSPALTVGFGVFAFMFATTIVSDGYHFTSDVLLGAAIGYAVGRWVVHHRASIFVDDPDGRSRRRIQDVQVVPYAQPGGSGMALAFSF